MGICNSVREEGDKGAYAASPVLSPRKLPKTIYLAVNNEGILIYDSPQYTGKPLVTLRLERMLGWGSSKERFKVVEERAGRAHEWVFASKDSELLINKLNQASTQMVTETDRQLQAAPKEVERKEKMYKADIVCV
eukprot:CAMPEP_0184504602 /NCGR_PEP_ID=MMETSP0113_2-20130426/52466_1 /TAXON_ID=91329 /ORGANISM="Norrisiella sphaerica, Strain BC52" /LENGTH=134 /DNA_ID=CAMNT_0026894255 /DNA_START=544 /DNA_END=948 /DNA_ORIENTATION=-